MDKIVEQGLLYDFYGELLTDHQKNIYEDAVLNDLSLAEIASEYGISRQGVHDIIKRCNHTLLQYEEKLHLVNKFLSIKEKVHLLQKLPDNRDLSLQTLTEKVKKLSDEILEEL